MSSFAVQPAGAEALRAANDSFARSGTNSRPVRFTVIEGGAGRARAVVSSTRVTPQGSGPRGRLGPALGATAALVALDVATDHYLSTHDMFETLQSERFPHLGRDKISGSHQQPGWLPGDTVTGGYVYAVRQTAQDGRTFTVQFEVEGLNYHSFMNPGRAPDRLDGERLGAFEDAYNAALESATTMRDAYEAQDRMAPEMHRPSPDLSAPMSGALAGVLARPGAVGVSIGSRPGRRGEQRFPPPVVPPRVRHADDVALFEYLRRAGLPRNVAESEVLERREQIDAAESGEGADGRQSLGPLTGRDWEFDPSVDLDLRGTEYGFQHALEEAFRRTGIHRDQFTPVDWAPTSSGGTIPVLYEGPDGAQVNIDIPQLNNVRSDGSLGFGPWAPHIGYQTPGRAGRIRGHIFADGIDATR